MNLEVFRSKDFGEVRVVIDEKTNEPWFVDRDVAKVLGYKDTVNAIKQHCDKEDVISLKDFLTGGEIPPHQIREKKIDFKEKFGILDYQTNFINESGLYALIFGSTLESAKKFKRWVTSEVLPSIRKTGGYQTKTLTPAEMLLETAKQIVELEKKQKEIELKADRANERLDRIETAVNFFTVVGYGNRVGTKLNTKLASKIGRRASLLCKQRDIRVGEVPDPRFGKVKAYPLEVLEEVFAENRL
jgi:prophage antirepressor-like protein